MTPEVDPLTEPARQRRPGEHSFLDRLHLERIDRDIFTGWCHAGAPLRAFGGQVAAQALVAAGHTVEHEERHVNSLHAYFLRPGRTTDPIVYLVDRPRDGSSFSTRRVTAVQYGETIFTLSASFAPPFDGPEHQATQGEFGAAQSWIHHIPPPEAGEPKSWPHSSDPVEAARLHAEGYPEQDFIEMRVVDRDFVAATGRAHQMAWLRSRQPLPDDPLVQVCALTYFSDLSLVGTMLTHHGGVEGTRDLQIASLDHAMWFHRPFRVDHWTLFVTDSPTAASGRGFARGTFYSEAGDMVASASQEALLRARRSPGGTGEDGRRSES